MPKRTLAERVISARLRADLSRSELAAQSGVDVTTVFRLERGETKAPSAITLARIAAALGMTSEALLSP